MIDEQNTNAAETPSSEQLISQKPDMKWYVLRTYSGHEGKVKAYIESQIVQSGMQEQVGAVLVPSEKVVELKDGKKKSRVKNFFPGYVLVQAVINQTTIRFLRAVPSVLGFIPNPEKPSPLSPDEVRRLIGRLEEKQDAESVKVHYHVGDAVKVTEGPFNNFQGFIQEVNTEKMKVKVMVSIFGRKTPVELDFSQVEIEK